MNSRIGKMFRPILRAVFFLAFSVGSLPSGAAPQVRMQTDLGGVDILLRDDVAPLTVDNFLDYMNTGGYDGTFIHRSIPGFVVQGGGFKFDPADGSFFTGGANHIPQNLPIANEAGLPGALLNMRGTLAMAKTSDPDSATSEWFFNIVDNPFLDDPLNSGGFTVFAEVLGTGMDIVDNIAEQDVCKEIIGSGSICSFTTYADTIIVGATNITAFDPDRLLLVNNIGVDSDGDGIIDRVEDAAPIGDDSNDDGTADRDQGYVATFSTNKGDYVTVEVPQTSLLQSMDVLGSVFELANPPTSFCALNGVDFTHNFMGFDLTGLALDGSLQVTITLDVGAAPETYYNFGRTPDNSAPHWYEFMFDDETGTGAVISGNEIILHFVDGKRGDADMDPDNGLIESTGGPAVFLDIAMIDDDRVADFVEDGAPNGGDGNGDEILDSLQGNVASFTDLNGGYLTIETDSGVPISVIDTNFSELPLPGQGVVDGQNFAHGFISFELCANTGTTARIILPEGEEPDAYIMYGPTPDNTAPHYYNFSYDGETGAEFDGNVITLHFVDGKRGDADLDGTNNAIFDPGAPAFRAINTLAGSGGGGGGCSLGAPGAGSATAGAWWLLMSLILLPRTRKACRRFFL